MTPPTVRPLTALLDQLFDLVGALTDDEYARKPVGVVESSVGGHVRHNLDHVRALLAGLSKGDICYDHRDRGTAVERDRVAAMDAILTLKRDLEAYPWGTGPSFLSLSTLVAPDLPPQRVVTTVGRELAFVVSHTIHHNALIAVLVKLLGVRVPADFGYAPATVVHQRSRLCAR